MIRSRRGALQVAALSAVLYLGSSRCSTSTSTFRSRAASRLSWSCRRSRVAQYTVAINLGGFFAVALLAGSLAESLRSAGARLEDASHRDSRPAGLQRVRHRQPAERPGHHRRDGRILTFNRAASTIIGVSGVAGRSVETSSRCCSCPRTCARASRRLTIGRSLKIDCQHRTADGRMIDIGLTASTLTLPEGGTG